jgi:hypothetical protein
MAFKTMVGDPSAYANAGNEARNRTEKQKTKVRIVKKEAATNGENIPKGS